MQALDAYYAMLARTPRWQRALGAIGAGVTPSVLGWFTYDHQLRNVVILVVCAVLFTAGAVHEFVVAPERRTQRGTSAQ